MRILLTALLLVMIHHQVNASHLLGGYLSYTWVSTNQYKITVTLLVEAESSIESGSGTVDFGDGQTQTNNFEVTLSESISGFRIATFSTLHQYSSFGTFEISYSESNYTLGINNIPQAASVPFFIVATIVHDINVGQNQSPALKLFNTQRGTTGVVQRMNMAAYDEDGDSLSYRLIAPRRDKRQFVVGYAYPNAPDFYLNYSNGNQTRDGVPTYSIASTNGEILWDAPDILGRYAIAYSIIQWRKINGTWINIGSNEVIFIDLITDTETTISITPPASRCYSSTSEVEEQFSLINSTGESVMVQVYSNAAGALLNGVPVSNDVFTFNLNEALTLNFTLTNNASVIPFKLYNTVISVVTDDRTFISSWTFSIGCDTLPDNVEPDPLTPRETCNEIIIYPNPAQSQYVKVCMPDDKNVSRIKIYNSLGEIITEKEALREDGTLEFDISDLISGTYILRINEVSKKLIVVR